MKHKKYMQKFKNNFEIMSVSGYINNVLYNFSDEHIFTNNLNIKII